jgi:hypothetical protein
MKTSLSKTSIIQLLLFIVVVLLVLNIIVEKYSCPESPSTAKEISSQVINKKFLIALNNYNLDSSWISKRVLSKNRDDSLKYFYIVKVPADLPISLLINEIKNQFDTNEVNIYAADLNSDASTEIKITSAGFFKLKAILNNRGVIRRQADSIAFLLTGIESLNSENLNELLMLPEKFACALIPSKQAHELSNLLNENHKQIAVILNDDITELEFKLNKNYSNNRIRNSLKSISGKFNHAAFFIIDENSDVYKSQHYKSIKDWFAKKRIVPENYFKEISFSSPENTFSLLKDEAKSQHLFRISAEKFLEILPVLASLRKIGDKIVYPSELIKPVN